MSDAESIVLSGSAISTSVGVSVAVAVAGTVGETVAVGKESDTGIVVDVISPSLSPSSSVTHVVFQGNITDDKSSDPDPDPNPEEPES